MKKISDIIKKSNKKKRTPVSKFFYKLLLLPLICVYSVVHAFYLLFLSPYHSFNFEAKQRKNGTYKHSYHEHLKLKRGFRAYTIALGLGIISLIYVVDLSAVAFSRTPWFTKEALADSHTWDGGGGVDTNWSNCDNWVGNSCPTSTDIAVFDGTSDNNAVINAAFGSAIGGIDINTGYDGTVSAQTTLSIGTSDLAIDSGTFDATDETITLTYADFTVGSGGTFTEGTSTIIFSTGGATFNVNSTETVHNLEVSMNAGWQLIISSGDTITVTDTLTLTEGYLQTGTIDLQGTISQGANFDGGNATISFGNDALNQTYTINNAYGMKVKLDDPDDANDQIILGADATMYGLEIAAGFGDANNVNFDYAGHILSIGVGDYIQASGIFTAPSTLIIIGNTAYFTKSGGFFTEGTNKVIFRDGSNTIDVATTETFYDMEIDAINGWACTVSSGDTIVVTNALTLTDGTLSTGTIDVQGTITQSADFDGGDGVINFADDTEVQTYTVPSGKITPIIKFDDPDDANDVVSLSGDATFYGLNITSDFDPDAPNLNVPITYNAHNLTIGVGDYTQASGIFTAPTILTIDGNGAYFVKSGGTFEEGTNTVVFTNGTNRFDMTGATTEETFYDVEIDQVPGWAMTIMTGDKMIVSHDLTLTEGQISTGTIDAQGTITISAGFDGGDGTLNFADDTEAQACDIVAGGIAPIIKFDDPDDANDDVNLNADTTFYGLNIAAGFGDANNVPINYDGYNLTLVSSGYTQDSGIFTPSSTLTIRQANFTKSGGEFVEGNGSVIFTIGSATLNVATTETFHDLQFNSTYGWTYTISSGDTIVTTGLLSLTEGYISVGTLEAQGDVTVSSGYDGGTSPLNFKGGNTQSFDLTGATGLYNADITVNKSGGAVNLASALVMDASNQDLTIQEGTFDLNNNALTVQGSATEKIVVETGGNLQLQGGETITPDSVSYPQLDAGSTVTYDGSSPYTIKDYTYSNLTIAGSSVFTLANTETINNVTISSGTLSLNNNGLTVSTTFTNDGTLRLRGNEATTITMDTNSGTVEFTGDDDDAEDTYTLTTLSNTYNNLTITSADGATDLYQLGAALDINNDLNIASGTFNVTAGNFDLTVGENFANTGTFNASAGKVIFDDNTKTSIISGTNTFSGFRCVTQDKNIKFTQAVTQNITGLLTLTGIADHEVVLRSTSDTNHWNLNFSGTQAVTYVDVMDSDASFGTEVVAGVTSYNAGNNDNWDFDGPTVNWTTSTATKAENEASYTITAEASYAPALDITVPYIVTGTATGGATDYSITASPITITAGNTTADITVTITNDTLDEDDETVIVTMGDPTNGIKGATIEHTGTITDNDSAPTVTFTSALQSGAENVGTMTITAELSTASGKNVSIPYTIAGTATGSGTDYSITASPISITAGNTTANITITVTDDTLDESNETVIATMGSPTNATQGATIEHTATITDNDPNNLPVADAGADQNKNESDASTTLDGTGSSDLDSDPLTYAWVETLDASDACSLSNNTSATPDVDFADKESNYSCEYRLIVNDTKDDSAPDTMTVNVTADNDAPSFVAITEKTIGAGSNLSFSVGANDQDTSTLTLTALDASNDYSAAGVDISTLFTDNGNNTGTFNWTPTYSQSGVYTTTFNAFDGDNNVTQVVNVTVTETNTAPTFAGSLPNVSFVAGDTASNVFDLDDYFTDAQDTSLTYSTAGNMNVIITVTDGQVSMTSNASYNGSEEISFIATDSET
ncbi:MAG: Calx-beta domain-containing protein [Patescibacteria group bacterium]